MIIFPAIDIKDGQAVRLERGLMDRATVYGQPDEMAVRWQNEGARCLHVVDLNAAFTGTFANKQAVAAILKEAAIPVQLGGGVRTLADVEERLNLGVARVMLGTVACTDPGLVREAAKKWPGRIAVSIDAKNGYVATAGWADDSDITAVELGRRMAEAGVTAAVFTDIARDGMMTGPNLEQTRAMIEGTGLDIIASGGMSSLDDVRAAKEAGAYGCILGRSIYVGAVSLAEAIKLGGSHAD